MGLAFLVIQFVLKVRFDELTVLTVSIFLLPILGGGV